VSRAASARFLAADLFDEAIEPPLEFCEAADRAFAVGGREQVAVAMGRLFQPLPQQIGSSGRKRRYVRFLHLHLCRRGIPQSLFEIGFRALHRRRLREPLPG
jgi:hypothetical protein